MKRTISALAVLLLWSLLLQGGEVPVMQETEEQQEQQETLAEPVSSGLRAGGGETAACLGSSQELSSWNDYLTLSEDEVYTFSQGPRAWKEGHAWGGEWCEYYVKGRSFGGFGCGLVCMANIYSTLTPYECSPLDMYHFATEATGYYPTKQSGAIDWGCMKSGLKELGFTCDLFYKPDTYEAFQEHIRRVDTAIVLVCSSDDDTYWEDTPGHYVNIWLYDEETDQVFLGEPGALEKNRAWVPLQYVYDALKTSSKFQYLAVWNYEEEKNTWKWDGINDNWNKP
ncbi:MAG: hypothetical protein HFI42_15700 [Lachnospiraceae bacterium]|nr:hypothetical protein [Lachnospiraceae bacterium]